MDFWNQVRTGNKLIKWVSESMQRPGQHHPKHQPEQKTEARESLEVDGGRWGRLNRARLLAGNGSAPRRRDQQERRLVQATTSNSAAELQNVISNLFEIATNLTLKFNKIEIIGF